MPEWKDTAMSLKKKLDKLHKLYTEEKQYRGKLTGTIYSLQDQLEEYKVQSEQRHVELNSEYQRQIQQTKAAEARSQSFEQKLTALREDRDEKSKVIEKLQQQLRVFTLAQKKDLESNTSNECNHAHGQSHRNQNLQIFRPKLESESSEPTSRCSHQEYEAHNKSRSNHLKRTGSTHAIRNAKNHEDSDSTRTFQCTQCASSFNLKASLKHHIRRVHEKVVNYRCGYCSKGFYDKGNHTIHLRVHTEERPFQCTICNKAFKQSNDLKKHMHVHSDEKPFQCTQCDSSFKRKGDLKKHIQSVHEKVVKYRCSHCSKGFYRKSSLTLHLRVHTGERPFQCKVCGKAFTTKGQVTRHERNLHGVEKSSDKNDKIQSDESEIFVKVPSLIGQ